jgi:hypothetical protein
MIKVSTKQALFGIAVSLILALHASTIPAQQPDAESVARKVDAAVKSRIDNLAGYTVTEHYAVFRSNDEIHAAAEMNGKRLKFPPWRERRVRLDAWRTGRKW